MTDVDVSFLSLLYHRLLGDEIYLEPLNEQTVMRIIDKEKPDAVLSTGAMIAYPALLLGKWMGKKIIFIECMFNVDAPTLTGKLAYRFADLFIVQWEEMLKVYPKAVLGGRVF